MIYAIDYGQLLGLSTVARLLGEIREISDATDRSEILTKAQIILTSFIIGLQPLSRDQESAFTLGASCDETEGFDA